MSQSLKRQKSVLLWGGLCQCSWRSAVVASGHVVCKHVNDRREWRERAGCRRGRRSGGGGDRQKVGGVHRHNRNHFFWVTEGTSFGPGNHPPSLGWVECVRPATVAVYCLDFIYNRQENWMGRTHGQDNPGNNMRTLSLSRTLAEDLHCCRLP